MATELKVIDQLDKLPPSVYDEICWSLQENSQKGWKEFVSICGYTQHDIQRWEQKGGAAPAKYALNNWMSSVPHSFDRFVEKMVEMERYDIIGLLESRYVLPIDLQKKKKEKRKKESRGIEMFHQLSLELKARVYEELGKLNDVVLLGEMFGYHEWADKLLEQGSRHAPQLIVNKWSKENQGATLGAFYDLMAVVNRLYIVDLIKAGLEKEDVEMQDKGMEGVIVQGEEEKKETPLPITISFSDISPKDVEYLYSALPHNKHNDPQVAVVAHCLDVDVYQASIGTLSENPHVSILKAWAARDGKDPEKLELIVKVLYALQMDNTASWWNVVVEKTLARFLIFTQKGKIKRIKKTNVFC